MSEDVRELKHEEMAKVSGGRLGEDEVIIPLQPLDPGCVKTTTNPYCKSCGYRVQFIGGVYVCDHVGCSEMGIPKKATEIIWK